MSSQRLDEVLHAAYLIQYCQDCDRNGKKNFDLGAILGEMDWVTELHRLLNGGELAMEDPNKRQVGGHHYKLGAYQHWDFVADNYLDYFEGQITKYISRWKNKNGKQDLEKSLHYLDKLISLYEDKRGVESVVRMPRLVKNYQEFVTTYKLSELEEIVVSGLLSAESVADLKKVREALLLLIEQWEVVKELR